MSKIARNIFSIFAFKNEAQNNNNVAHYSRAVVIGTLLTVAVFIGLSGCPEEGGTTRPPGPANLAASSANGEITLNWQAIDTAVAYRVYRNGVRIAADTAITALTYTDNRYTQTDPTNSSEYSYTVRAVNAAGVESAASEAVRIVPPVTVRQVVTGTSYTCARLDNNSVKCWGYGNGGVLGQGNTNNIGDGVTGNLTVAAAPAIDLGSGRTATQIAAGFGHTCVLLDNGRIKCWGNGTSGALGRGNTGNIGDGPNELGDNLEFIDLGTRNSAPLTATQVGAGLNYTCALLTSGGVKCWGESGNGQLGQGNTNDIGDTAGELGDNLDVIDLGSGLTATQISTGLQHTCALLDNGSVKCWGNGGNGRLGQGNTNNIGDGGMTEMVAHQSVANAPVIDLGMSGGVALTATQISAGAGSTCALLTGGDIKCWGDGGSGQLGNGSTNNIGDGGSGNLSVAAANPINLGSGRTAIQISTAISQNPISGYACALLDNNAVKCWGNSDNGKLGQGSVNIIGATDSNEIADLAAINLGTNRTARQVSATGNVHACALLANNGVKCWGNGGNGRLGQGNTNNIGDEAGELGDNLPFVDFGLRQ